ncbi:MAG: hypothetical protein Q3982_07035 [Phoenicibacter congonensis]|uniref:Uncharacterized protein n=1 Tax=Phoenicibacter congonensis TaxID=1944646 RepID=A0AA43UAH7_9ACTN|nr:hypothetical protein [Phoenicibacter congonensis]
MTTEDTNLEYLEQNLPTYLETSLSQMKESWEKVDAGLECLRWGDDWCDLQSSINCAEVDGEITHEQAAYLRNEYLRITY